MGLQTVCTVSVLPLLYGSYEVSNLGSLGLLPNQLLNVAYSLGARAKCPLEVT